MFANSRMFWNVRPIPKRTISLGRALRKIPARCRRCTYHGGRMIATMSEPIRSPIATSTSSSPPISRRAAMLTAAKTPNTTGKANQKNGSAQVRRGRATTGSPANEIVPSLGSSRPAMTLKNVVLPAPLGPMRLTIEPSGMSKSIGAHRDEAAEPLRDPAGVEQEPRRSHGSGDGRPRRGGRGGRRRGDGSHRVHRARSSVVGSLFRLDPGRRVGGRQLVLGRRLVELASPAPAREQALGSEQHHPHQRQAVQQVLVVDEVDRRDVDRQRPERERLDVEALDEVAELLAGPGSGARR